MSWLQELFEEELPGVGELADVLSSLGLAVETVHEQPGIPEGVIAARVDEVEAIAGSSVKRVLVSHPGAQVQVVCGAPNVAVGQIGALVRPGAVLPGAEAPVAVRTVRGVESDGMLASPRELGVYDHAAGIATFGPDVDPGTALAALWPAETVIELELTPNRADAFSVLGVARDLGAKLGLALSHPAAGFDPGDPGLDDGLTVDVQDPAGAPRFTLRRVTGLTVGPSPVWLQRRLGALGLRPRNNVVDVTNYVTFELGQPSHAYDVRALRHGTVEVRRARAGEELSLLSEETIRLSEEDLVIATPSADGGSVAIGLAGVMGGLHDSVRADTTEVALEVAAFDPVTVRRSAKRHKLVTDARTRFERGVDPNLPPAASARAAALIAQVAGGTVHPGLSSFGSEVRRSPVAFRPASVGRIMGFDVPERTQRGYLVRLGFDIDSASDAGASAESWSVTPPSWRFDVTIEEDLVEEVGRLHGYENIGVTVPAMRFVPPATDPTHRELRSRLAAMGLQETITYVFTSPTELERSRSPQAVVELSDPQGVDRSVLRTSLLPGLVAAAVANRREDALALFEVGRVFLAEERERVALLMRGPALVGAWRADIATDFYVLKGKLEALAGLAGVTVELTPGSAPQLHPGAAAVVRWDGTEVGFAGRLHPEVEAAYELPATFFAELSLPLPARRVRFAEFSRQPHAERDLAIVAPAEVSYAALAELASAAAGHHLESVEPFDVYAGEQVGEGMRSVALRLTFRDEARALTDAEVDDAMENVIRAVQERGYAIRA